MKLIWLIPIAISFSVIASALDTWLIGGASFKAYLLYSVNEVFCFLAGVYLGYKILRSD